MPRGEKSKYTDKQDCLLGKAQQRPVQVRTHLRYRGTKRPLAD